MVPSRVVNQCVGEVLVVINIYVGNLPFVTDEPGLRALFEPFGSLAKVTVVSDRESGKSRGFGFVEMGEEAAARRAIEALHGRELHGRDLIVREAEPKSWSTPSNQRSRH
jgi:RNA recognition motif-containing protein